MQRHTCLCLKCGRHFDFLLADGEDPANRKCPVCGGGNLVDYNPASFFSSLFGTGGG